MLGVIAAQHRLLLPQVPAPVVHAVVNDAGRGDHRGIGEPQRGGIELGVAAAAHRPYRLGKLDVVLGTGLEIPDAELGRRVLPLPDRQVIPECVHPLQPDVVASCDDLAPVLARRGCHGGLDQPEVDRSVVGGDEEPIAVVLDGVLDQGPPGLHQPRRSLGSFGIDEPNLTGAVAAEVDGQEAAAPGAEERQEVEAVGLLEHHFVVVLRVAQPVAHHPEGALGLVQRHIEEPLAVGAPLDRGGYAVHMVGQQGGAFDVEDLELVLFVARGVGDIGQELVVG